jgi:hypothetical protein
MKRIVVRSFVALVVVAAGSLVVACGSVPTESSRATTDPLKVTVCPVDTIQDCSESGRLVSCTPCYNPADNTYAITDLAQPPSLPKGSTPEILDLSPFPYPSALLGMGCTKTAVYYSGPHDKKGGGIWYCPISQLVVPARIDLLYTVITGTTIKSAVLGSPKPGWMILSESALETCVPPPDDPNGCGHGCSGACGVIGGDPGDGTGSGGTTGGTSSGGTSSGGTSSGGLPQ